MLSTFNSLRLLLIAAIREATRGLGDLYLSGLLELPQVLGSGGAAEWLYAISGSDGTGGLLLEARIAMESPRLSAESRAAWRRAYELMLGLREVLRELPAEPAKAS